MKKRPDYELIFTREYTVLTAELWDYAERDVYFQLLDIAIPVPDDQFFEWKEGVVKDYLHMDQVETTYLSVLERNKKDPTYIKNIETVFWENYEKAKPFLQLTKKPASTQELAEIFEMLALVWGAYCIFYWFSYLEYPGMTEEIRAEANAIRKTAEHLTEECDVFFRKSIAGLYPTLSPQDQEKIMRNDLASNAIPRAEDFLRRRYLFIMGTKVTYEHSLEEFLESRGLSLKPIILEKAGELKGTIAFRGKVKGRAVICPRAEDITKVREGDILIAPMTTPNYLPALAKVATFVTDEGGITCHAAIVARELKKPCVIGTKVATKVFKDGDLVEVDAEKGIITIIKKG